MTAKDDVRLYGVTSVPWPAPASKATGSTTTRGGQTGSTLTITSSMRMKGRRVKRHQAAGKTALAEDIH